MHLLFEKQIKMYVQLDMHCLFCYIVIAYYI